MAVVVPIEEPFLYRVMVAVLGFETSRAVQLPLTLIPLPACIPLLMTGAAVQADNTGTSAAVSTAIVAIIGETNALVVRFSARRCALRSPAPRPNRLNWLSVLTREASSPLEWADEGIKTAAVAALTTANKISDSQSFADDRWVDSD